MMMNKKVAAAICMICLVACAAILINNGNVYAPDTPDPGENATAGIPAVTLKIPSENGNTDTETAGVNLVVIKNTHETASPQPDGAVIAFTFDDGCLSDYELAWPVLKEYGIRGTSYIAPIYQDEGKKFTMTWEQIREMADYGWVLGCHTYAHVDLSVMTQKEIVDSMKKVNEAFVREGLSIPAVHAYPYGRYNEDVIQAIKPFRKQARKAYYESKFVDPDSTDPYQIDCISADMQTEKRLMEKEALVDKACAESAVIVFRCHCLYKSEVNDMGEWVVQTDSALFKKLVEYCVEKDCRFVTMTELMGMYDG